jgi:hypothetical protein
MDKYLFHAFEKLTDTEAPRSVHLATIRDVSLKRYRAYGLVITVFFSGSFLYSIWHIYNRLVEIDVLTVLSSIGITFEPSLNSIWYSLQTLVQFLPIETIILSILNLASLLFMISLIRSFDRFQKKLNPSY